MQNGRAFQNSEGFLMKLFFGKSREYDINIYILLIKVINNEQLLITRLQKNEINQYTFIQNDSNAGNII